MKYTRRRLTESRSARTSLLSNVVQVALVIITFGLLAANLWQVQTNRDTLNLLKEQVKYSLIRPRLTINRESSSLTPAQTHFSINVMNIGNSPALDVVAILERGSRLREDMEFFEKWTSLNWIIRDTLRVSKVSIQENSIAPAENVDIKIEIGSMFRKDLEGKTEPEKRDFFHPLYFNLYLYYRDVDDQDYLACATVGTMMKSPLILLSPETAEVLKEYEPTPFSWDIRHHENVELQKKTLEKAKEKHDN